MPNSPSLELEPHGADTFVGESPEYPWGRIYGGLVVAQALAAATATVDPEHHVHSLHAYFILGGVVTEPVRYEVDRIRNGRSFSTRRVVARQSAGAILNLSASFQRLETEQPDLQAIEAPDAPDPETVPQSEWEAGFDYREVEFPAGEGRSLAWARYQGELSDDPRDHAAALAYLSDGNPMDAIFNLHPVKAEQDAWHETFVSASLDHSVWFHRPVRADEWVLFDLRSPTIGGSRGVARGEMFQDGVLVATVVQEGLLRVRNR